MPADSAATLREALQVDLGGALQAHFLREVSGDAARVVRGAIRVAEARASGDRAVEPTPLDPIEALPLPATGVAANVNLKRLDVEAWQAALARLQGDGARAGAGARPRGRRWCSMPPVAPATSPTRSRCASASSSSARVASANVTAGLSQQAELWRANVGADELEGYVEYRPARRGAAGAAPAACSLAWPASACPRARSSASRACSTRSRRRIPALDIVVDDFELRGKRLGRLEIEATNRAAGNRDGAREWQLAKLNLTMPEAQLTATGTWGDARRRRRARRGARR